MPTSLFLFPDTLLPHSPKFPKNRAPTGFDGFFYLIFCFLLLT